MSTQAGRRVAITAGSLAVLLGALDAYVVVTIMRDIMTDVGIPVNKLQRITWIVTMYLLGYIAAMPLLGRASDRFGRKLLLQASLALFIVGSVVTALSVQIGQWNLFGDDPNTAFHALIIGRTIQGVASGALLPVTLALGADLWAQRNRAGVLGGIGAAQELGSVLQQLGGVANTSIGGRYVFGGDSDQTAPYTIDLTQSNPISAYAGTPSTRQVELPGGATIAIARTAQDLFDSPNAQTNVFQTINSLRTALLNNDQAGIDAALPNVRAAGDYLNSQLSFYGEAQNQVNQGVTSGGDLVTQLKTRLSGIQDADLTQAITEFTQANTAEQAALSSRAKIPRGSLFDYLG